MSSDTWVCIASGPSLCEEDIQYCRDKGWSLLAVNTSFKLAPDAKIIYGADYRWWERYHEEAKQTKAELWTASSTCAKKFNLNHVSLLPGPGWTSRKGYAYSGSLSGFQAIQIAGWHNPSRIILLGYDMQHTGGKTHWHDDHPLGWPNCPKLDAQIEGFSKLAKKSPVPIINCTRETALQCFTKKELVSIV